MDYLTTNRVVNLTGGIAAGPGPRKRLLGKPLSSACLRPGSFFCAVPRWSVRLERSEKVAGDCCYLVNGSKECSFVGFRWLVEAAHLSHELQCGRTNLFLVHRRFEVEERLDVSTHKHYLDCQSHLTFEFSDVANEMVNFWSLDHYSRRKRKLLANYRHCDVFHTTCVGYLTAFIPISSYKLTI